MWQWSSEKALQFARVKAKSVYVLHIGRRDQIRSDLCDSSSCACACGGGLWDIEKPIYLGRRALPQRPFRDATRVRLETDESDETGRREWMADS